MENERLESLLIQAHQIMVERDRRNEQAQSDLRETIETNNNIVNSVIASSVTATIQKESTSEAYFKFIS
jgi:DNA-binding protein H-NS